MIDLVILRVNTTADCTTHAFFPCEVEPYHSIEAALLEGPWRLLFASWLHQKEGITEVLLSWDRIHFLRWNITAQGSFKKFRLSKGGWEIEKNPAILFNLVRFLDLSLQFVDLDLDLCGILLLLSLANCSTWGTLSLLSGRICDLLKLLDKAGNLLSLLTLPFDLLSDLRPYLLLRLVGIGESKLGDVELDVDLIRDLLTLFEELRYLQAAQPEVFSYALQSVSVANFFTVIRHGWVLFNMLLHIFRGWLSDGLRVLLVIGEDLVHQITKLIGLEAELLSHLLGLGLLASEVVPNEAHFKSEVLRHLGALLRCAGWVV